MGRSGGGVINKRLCSWRLQAVACFTHCLFFFSLVIAPTFSGSTEGVFDALDRRTDSHLRNICE